MLEVLDTSILYCVQEAERRRIARDLHDGVVQSLTALLADLEYFRTCHLREGGGETAQELAAKVATWQELARDCLMSMRHALGGFRAGEAERDLETLIQSLLLEMEQVGYTVTY